MPQEPILANILAEPSTADVNDIRLHGYRPGPLPDWMRYGGVSLANVLAGPRGEIRNTGPRPTAEWQERVAEGISPVGNMFTPAREAYQAAQRGDWAGAAEHGGPLALGALLPIPGAKPRIPNPIKAYHGSPHDFDKFDLSKIGTGEGAQAYGHGLYFAESEGVARSYRDTLTPGPSYLERFGGNRDSALVHLRRELAELEAGFRAQRGGADPGPGMRRVRPEMVEEVRRAISDVENDWRGRMYEVNLHARPEQFLDWDKPLSGQSGAVKDALDRVGGIREAPNVPESYLSIVNSLADTHGLGKAPFEEVRAAISKTLADEGIPGIRYLDQGSRGTGQGTHNYSVWTPEIIEILRKYGIAAPALMAPALTNTLAGDEKPSL